jgi:hypothetical protein
MKQAVLPLFALLLCASSSLKAQCPDQFEPNDIKDAPAEISSSSSFKATIASPEDVDFYHFHVGANQILTVRLDSMDADLNLVLYRDKPTNNWVYTLTVGTSSNSGTTPELITIEDGPYADYYVKVSGADYPDVGCYHLSVETTTYSGCPDAYEPNDMSPNAGLSDGVPVSARISNSEDVDLFSYNNPNGEYVKIDLVDTLGSGYDISLVDTRRNDDGSFYYLSGLDVNYTSTGITAYFDNYNERTYNIMVTGGGSHASCYQLIAQSSGTPFNARKSSGIEVTQPVTAKVFPVPAKNVIYSMFSSKVNKSQEVVITDISGKVVYRQKHAIIAGMNKLEIVLPASLEDGVYIISNGISSQKFLLKR